MMAWNDYSDGRYYPFYDPETQDMHVQFLMHSYQKDEYRGYPLSEKGYKEESDMFDAMDDAKLPPEVEAAYEEHKKTVGKVYRGILD